MKENTFFDDAVEYFTNNPDELDFYFSCEKVQGYYNLRAVFGRDIFLYRFDEDVVDELNEYLKKLWDDSEELFDDIEEFYSNTFFDCLEEIIEDLDAPDLYVDVNI